VLRAWRTGRSYPTSSASPNALDPDASIEVVGDDIELIATEARAALGVETRVPLADLVDLLEDQGIVAVRDPETDNNIDAYSAVVNEHPIVVLD
jgi:hypothetical protein